MTPPIHAGPFELLDPLGAGGMGTVWRAHHPGLDVDVAVKVLSGAHTKQARDIAQFHREVRAVAAMDHPHIVAVLDSGEIPADNMDAKDELPTVAGPWLAMELATDTLAQSPPGDWPATRAVAFAVLDALAHAHARGALHRDIKPANVLRVGAGGHRIVLSDFGLTTFGAEPARSSFRGGSRGFAAPEQWSGEAQGPWTDLYAVGRLIHALVFGGTESTIRRFPVPTGYDAWIARLTTIVPQARYQRAADAAYALMLPQLNDAAAADGNDMPQAAWGQTLSFLLSFNAVGPPPPVTVPLVEATPLAVVPPTLPSSPQVPTRHRPPHLPGVGIGLFGDRAVRLVGREAGLDELWRTVTRVAAGGSAHVVLTGPSGVGKTRLAQEIVWRAHEVGVAQVFEAGASIEAHDRPVTLRWLDAAPAPAGPVPSYTLWLRTSAVAPSEPNTPEVLALDPLDRDATGRLVRAVLPLGPGAAGWLEVRAAGSPRYVLDSIAAWVASGVLTDEPGGLSFIDAAAPRPMPWVDAWRERVNAQISAKQRSCVELMATWGPELSHETWRLLATHTDGHDDVPWESLIAEGWIGTTPTGWTWRVPEVRDVVLRTAATSGRSRTWHRACALAVPEHPLAGWHQLRAGEGATALEPLRYGAMTLHLKEGQSDLALAVLDEALAWLARTSDPTENPMWWSLRVSHATALMQVDLQAARSVVDSAWKWAEANDEDGLRLRAMGQMSRMAKADGDHEAAMLWAHRSIAVHRAMGDRRMELISSADLANAQLASGDADKALKTYRAVLEAFSDFDDPIVLTWVLTRTSLAYRQVGAYDESGACLDRARALDVPTYRIPVRSHACELARRRGNLDEAEALARANLAEMQAANSGNIHVTALNLALLALMRGNAAECLDLALAHTPANKSVGHAYVKQFAVALVAVATAALGEWDALGARLEDWSAVLNTKPNYDDDLEWLLTHAEQICAADPPVHTATMMTIRQRLTAQKMR